MRQGPKITLAGTNLEQTKSFNRRVVLEAVRLHGPISRAEIARLTGLSAQTISNIVEELQAASLLRSQGRRIGNRGQPAVELVLNPEGGYSCGVYFDHRHLVAVLIDIAGTVHDRFSTAIERAPPDEFVLEIEAAANSLVERCRIAPERLLGLGVVMPSLSVRGSLVSFGPTSLPGWEHFPLAERLCAKLGLPVIIENDATAAAVGERLYGAGRELQTFFHIFFGVGLGGGLIANGLPFRGATGMAGELGHIVIEPGGLPCPCGNRGCLERYVSLQAGHQAVFGDTAFPTAIRTEDLMERYLARDPKLLAWLAEAAIHLRTAIGTIENLFDPETIVIGGEIPGPMLDDLIGLLDPLAPSTVAKRPRQAPRVVKSQLGYESPALGAAALPVLELLTPGLGRPSRETFVQTRC